MGMAEREAKCRSLVRKYYSDVPSRESVMDEVIAPLLDGQQRLLDARCGAPLFLLNRYGPDAAFTVGMDVVTPSGKPEGRSVVTVGDLARLPFKDASFDLIVSRSVFEHLERPTLVFKELSRTLKPGGRLVFTTPNKYDYASLVAWVIPYSWKDFYLRRVFGEESYDHFPVFYRANSPRALRRVATESGLCIERLQALRHFPYYLLFSPTLFRIGMLYDWQVTALGLDCLKSTWLVVMGRAQAPRCGPSLSAWSSRALGGRPSS